MNLSPKTTCLERWSLKTGGLWWQVHLHGNVGFSANNWWSFKTGGLWRQWSLKAGFTVYVFGIAGICQSTAWHSEYQASQSCYLVYSCAKLYQQKAAKVALILISNLCHCVVCSLWLSVCLTVCLSGMPAYWSCRYGERYGLGFRPTRASDNYLSRQ